MHQTCVCCTFITLSLLLCSTALAMPSRRVGQLRCFNPAWQQRCVTWVHGPASTSVLRDWHNVILRGVGRFQPLQLLRSLLMLNLQMLSESGSSWHAGCCVAYDASYHTKGLHTVQQKQHMHMHVHTLSVQCRVVRLTSPFHETRKASMQLTWWLAWAYASLHTHQ